MSKQEKPYLKITMKSERSIEILLDSKSDDFLHDQALDYIVVNTNLLDDWQDDWEETLKIDFTIDKHRTDIAFTIILKYPIRENNTFNIPFSQLEDFVIISDYVEDQLAQCYCTLSESQNHCECDGGLQDNDYKIKSIEKVIK